MAKLTKLANGNATGITLTQKDLGKGDEGQGRGLEINIQGLKGNPADGCSVWIEYFEGKVQLHVWTNNEQNPQTITLT